MMICMLAGILSCAAPAEDSVRAKAWEDTLTLPTYPPAPDDLNPHFRAYENAVYYPYTLQDRFTTEPRDVAHRVLILENEFLRVTFMPDIGGRIYSALDKTTGEELFYRNKVIKPGYIALRGAWVNGGVEWNNGPQNHTVTSFAPVDASFVNHADGSASVVIGDTEAVNRTRWTAWITLRPGKAYLEERIRIENETDLPQPFYFWNNAKFIHHDRVRFIVPASLMVEHGGKHYYPWPIRDGVDLSYVKNHHEPTSLFAVDCPFDFFGAYDLKRDHGVVIYADHKELVGKKIWTWGMSDDARASLANLTDDDTGDIEIQSGPLATQEDYGLLLPHERVEWQEWWYPIHSLRDGFDYATRDVALRVERTKGSKRATVRVAATASFPGASVAVYQPVDASAARAEKRMDLTPAKTQALDFDLADAGPARISVRGADGTDLASFVSPLQIPAVSTPDMPKEAETASAESKYLGAMKHFRGLAPTESRADFEAALATDPGYAAALRDLAALDLSEARDQSAAQRLTKALERNPDDSLAWYYLGVARLRMDDLEGALDAAAHTIRTVDRAEIGHDLEGQALARQGKWDRALEAFDETLRSAPGDSRTQDHRLIALHALRNTEALTATLLRTLDARPLALVPRLVKAFGQNGSLTTAAAQEFLHLAGWDEFMITEAALEFADLGRYDEAAQIAALLQNADATRGRPLPYYFGAYFLHRLQRDDNARALLVRAAAIKADYVFLKRPESLPVLQYALSVQPNDARAWLYLGSLYAGLNQTGVATGAWKRAVEIDSALSVAHRNLAVDAWRRAKNLPEAEAQFRAAIAAAPDDQTLYRDLAHVLVEQNRADEAITVLETMPQHDRRLDVIQLLADTHLRQDAPANALKVLASTRFTNREGSRATWITFSSAHLMQGRKRFDANEYKAALEDFRASLTYPANLGVGRPAHPEESESYYWIGLTLEKLNRLDEARKAFSRSAEGPDGSNHQKEFKAKSCAWIADHR
ncbi:MAG: DUF5107 domain-containing protein [Candidatus Hydrogenedentes bacterium]|nr:DUF5107 domain-containing protein [Candidatus Hydrogenedentota bacterium]